MTYSVHVTITSAAGASIYHLDVPTGNDVRGDVTPVYGLADPLTITQALPSGDVRLPLAQPLPDEATITIIAQTATDYADMRIGDPVGVQVYPAGAYAGTPTEFYGRILTLDAAPSHLGVVYTLGCIDYLNDLGTMQIGAGTYPAESPQNRVTRICNDAGIPDLTRMGGWGALWSTNTVLGARAASTTDALSLLIETMDSTWSGQFRDENGTSVAGAWPLGPGVRPVLRPVITGGLLDPVTPFGWSMANVGAPGSAGVAKRVSYAPPARITNVAGVRTVTVAAADSSPATGAPIIDGGQVAWGATFTQPKEGLPYTIWAQNAQGGWVKWSWDTQDFWGSAQNVPNGSFGYGLGGMLPGPATAVQITSIVDTTDPQWATGGFNYVYATPYRPDTQAAWSPGTFTWQAWNVAGWRRPALTELLTVSRVATNATPLNREWVAGLVTATTLTVAGGRPTITIQTIPNTLNYEAESQVLGATNGVCRFDSPILGTTTLAQLSPRDTFQDYRLVRGS